MMHKIVECFGWWVIIVMIVSFLDYHIHIDPLLFAIVVILVGLIAAHLMWR